MYKNAKDNGITLVSLVVTIVILLIISTIAYETGKGTLESAKLSAYRAEMTIMQEEVDKLEQQYRQGKINQAQLAMLGEDPTGIEGAEEAFNSANVDAGDKSGYRYFTAEDLKDLGIENIENDYLINIEKRSVISLDGVKYHGETYYTLADVPGGKYIVEHTDQVSTVSFNLKENIGWPYNTKGITLDRWYGVPVTLESNVLQLHQELFGQTDYVVPDNIKEISDRIIAKTGYKN